eukprot:Em0049g1a
MATFQVTPPENFSFMHPEEWPKWIRRFERFRQVSGLDTKEEETQVSNLIYCMGDEADDILRSFGLSADDSKKYSVVKGKFESHFVPRRNVIFERAKFNQRRQEDGETVDAFITDLYRLAEYCDYKVLQGEMVRDRIVVGIRDSQLSEKLQMDPNLTLEKAVAQSRQAESVKKQQAIIRCGQSQPQPANIDAVSPGRQQQQQPLRTKGPQPAIWKSTQSTHGTQSKCPNCGKGFPHDRSNCPARNATCNKCGKLGHFQAVCRSSTRVKEVFSDNSEALDAVYIRDLANHRAGRNDSWLVTLQLNGQPVTFKLDTGADVTVIPMGVLRRQREKTKLYPAQKRLHGPNNQELPVRGCLKATLAYRNATVVEEVYVVPGLHTPLLGRPAIESLGLITRIASIGLTGDQIPLQYPNLFKGLGKLKGEYTIRLREGACPFALMTPRRVAIPLLPRVKAELERMVQLGTNESVCRERHPLPVVEQVLAQLTGAKVFSRLDANSGFWQIPLSPESALLTTFITPFGRFCFHRLPFGITSAPEHFQKRMLSILSGVEGVLCMMDDILVHGKTQEEHDSRLHEVLRRIQRSGLTLNKEKCFFSLPEVKFLGQVIDSEGIRPDPAKVSAIRQVPEPTNIGDVRRFLGMVNQLSKFSPNVAERTQPLRDLLSKKNMWIWGEAQKKAFQEVKEALSSRPLLAFFDPVRETIVSADASSFGLGAVLLQKQLKGELRPIAYVSRAMTPTEKRYAQIEKEALALTWACERFSDYLIGLQFHLQTDHKPLVPLFSNKNLDELPIRVQRFRLRLMRYSFTISHVAGKDLAIADALSRAPVSEPTADDLLLQKATNAFIDFTMEYHPKSEKGIQRIRRQQEVDAVIKQVARYCLNGWPEKKKLPGPVRAYSHVSAELTVVKGLLMRGARIVIPESMRPEMLKKIHEGHQGITKCRERARQSVWWPGLSKHIEELVQRCPTCCKEQIQRAEPLLTTPLPTLPWQKVAMDIFEWEKCSYLLMVDYYSRFIESNGEAERAVRTVKSLWKKDKDPFLALLIYRATPLEIGYSPAELLMCRRLRTTLPMAQEQRVPKLPDPTVLSNKNDQVKGRQKKNFDADHGVKMLPTLHPGDTVWILDRHTMGRVVKEIAPRSFVVETQEGNFRQNRRGLVLMPKDRDERGGDMSEEEETADEQGRRRVEDESDKLRDVAEEDKQVDTEISNREPQDEEEKDEGEKHVDTEISNSEPQDEKKKDEGDREEPETRDTKDPRRERQAPRMEPKEEHVIRTRSGRISRRPDYY